MSAMLNFHEIRRRCLATKKLYKDPEFQPSEKILLLENKKNNVQWLRPKEICKSPKFVVDGFSRFDVMQGSLGDCWFLAALATLTQNKKLFEKVVPIDNDFDENYAGVFHFRFWKHGEWHEVIIDDYLPVNQGQLMFIKAPKSEFWAALLEKAYAKLYGSYGAIESGNPSEAMIDFTGGIIETFPLEEAEESLFTIIRKANERGSLIATCKFKNDEAKGLFGGHAYTVTKAHVIKMNSLAIKIVGIRNPWGNRFEWNGAFGDKSSEWSMISKEELLRLELRFEDDGEFHMKFDDFLRYFDWLEMCHWCPGGLEVQDNNKKWCENIYHGQWNAGSTFNPQVIVKLVDPDEYDDDDFCTIIVSMSVKNRRRMRLNYIPIQFHIYKINKTDVKHDILKSDVLNESNKVGSHKLERFRDISARFRLLPGYYAIVPTSGSYEGGEFMLRTITEATTNRNDVIVKVNELRSRQHVQSNRKSGFEAFEIPLSSAEPSRQRRKRTSSCLSIIITIIIVLAFMFLLMMILEPEKGKNFFLKFQNC